MDCRYVRNKKLYEIIKERINKHIEELNQDKNDEEALITSFLFPFEISENDVHIVKICAPISKKINLIGDMFTFAIFSNELELDEVIDYLVIEDSELEFEITESTVQICECISRFPLYYSSELYLSLIPDSINLEASDRIINLIPFDGALYHFYVAIEQKRKDMDKLIIFEVTERAAISPKKLNIFKIRERKYVDVEQEDNKKVGYFQKISNFISSFFNKSDNTINNNYMHLKID